MNRAQAIGLLATGWNRGGAGEKEASISPGAMELGNTVAYIANGFRVGSAMVTRVSGVLDDIESKALTFGRILLFITGAILVVLILK